MPGIARRLSRHQRRRRRASARRMPRRADRPAPDRRRPAVRRTARSRARPAAAGASRDRCRCARGPSSPAHPRRRADAGRSRRRVEQRTIGVLAVLVAVAEQELAERDEVACSRRTLPPRVALAAPSRSSGWLMPSAKPNGSTPSRFAVSEPAHHRRTRRPSRARRPTARTRRARRAPRRTSRARAAVARRRRPTPTATERCRRRRRVVARDCRRVMPARNSGENPASTSSATPSAARPAR